jgi:hypothetical protein
MSNVLEKYEQERARHQKRLHQIDNRWRVGLCVIGLTMFLTSCTDWDDWELDHAHRVALVGFGSWLMVMALVVFIGLIVHQRLKEAGHD